MDYAKINEAAQNYLEDMTRFLRAILAKAVMKKLILTQSPLK